MPLDDCIQHKSQAKKETSLQIQKVLGNFLPVILIEGLRVSAPDGYQSPLDGASKMRNQLPVMQQMLRHPFYLFHQTDGRLSN